MKRITANCNHDNKYIAELEIIDPEKGLLPNCQRISDLQIRVSAHQRAACNPLYMISVCL